MKPMKVCGIALRNIVVLTETALEVTSHFSNGKYIFSGVEMVQRFFFDRVSSQCCHLIVNIGNQFSLSVFANLTDSCLTWLQLTKPGAKLTFYHMVITFFIKKSFVHFYVFHSKLRNNFCYFRTIFDGK